MHSALLSLLRVVREGLTVLLLFSFIAYSVVVSRSSAATEKSTAGAVQALQSVQQRKPFIKKDQCPNCGGPAANQEIYVPLIDLPEARGSEIVFNSRSPHAMTVTPTFYTLEGNAVIADPVTVQSAEIRYVEIKDLLPREYRKERRWGGLTLSYFGFNREMWSQVRFLGVDGEKSVDEFFTVKEESRSDHYEAVWWQPEASKSIIALGNITEDNTSATVSFGDDRGQNVELAPHATKLLYYKHDNDERPGSIVVEVTGAPGSIVPTGLIAGKRTNFNSVIRFYSPKLAKQSKLFANGFHVDGTVPHMMLKNTTASSITVVPKVIPLAGLAATPIASSPVALKPYEAREVDLARVLRVATKRALDVVSVEVENPAAAGSLIGAIYSINGETGVNYDVPLRDSGPVRTMTGSYPWKIADDFTTVVYITNISDQKAEFLGEINYEGGRRVIDPRSLSPGETAVFDLEKIRADQIRDSAGKVVAREASLGQFKWTVHGVTNGKLLLIGRAEMISKSQNISTSYSCNDPCPPFIQGSLDPFLPPIIFVSRSGSSTAWTSAYYGNGYVSGPYAAGADWQPDSSAVTMDPSAAHTTSAIGESTGGVCVFADMGREESYGWDGLNCYDNYNQYQVGDNTCTEVADVHIKMGSDNITGQTKNVIVGQQIPLSLEVVGTTDTVSNIQWSVPGTRIANYVASLSSGTVTAVSNLQASTLTFYWTDGGDNRQVTLGCRIGTEQFSKDATFNIKRPTASVTTSTGTVDVFTPAHGNAAGLLALEYGDPSPGTPGIKFTESHTIPQGFNGDFEWIQVVDTTRTRTTNANVVQTLQGTGGDNVYPYPFTASHVTEDSPGSVLTVDYKAYSASDSFTMYLMFRPTGTAIWVPLRKVDWSWSGAATRSGSGNTWTRTSRSNDVNPADADATDCPTWTASVGSLQFH